MNVHSTERNRHFGGKRFLSVLMSAIMLVGMTGCDVTNGKNKDKKKRVRANGNWIAEEINEHVQACVTGYKDAPLTEEVVCEVMDTFMNAFYEGDLRYINMHSDHYYEYDETYHLLYSAEMSYMTYTLEMVVVGNDATMLKVHAQVKNSYDAAKRTMRNEEALGGCLKKVVTMMLDGSLTEDNINGAVDYTTLADAYKEELANENMVERTIDCTVERDPDTGDFKIYGDFSSIMPVENMGEFYDDDVTLLAPYLYASELLYAEGSITDEEYQILKNAFTSRDNDLDKMADILEEEGFVVDDDYYVEATYGDESIVIEIEEDDWYDYFFGKEIYDSIMNMILTGEAVGTVTGCPLDMVFEGNIDGWTGEYVIHVYMYGELWVFTYYDNTAPGAKEKYETTMQELGLIA